MAIRHTIYDIDLSKQLQRVFSGVLLASNDKLANRMGANVYQDGKAVSLAGYTVKGYFIRNGVDTLILDGAVSGNAATVDLPSNCYYKDGSYTLTVKLCKGNTEQTLVIFDGRIAKTTTDTIVENENTISVADLVQHDWVQNVMDAADAIMGSGGNVAPAITCNVAGEVIGVQDAASRAPRALNLYGKTMQATTPTPDAPADLTNAASGGTVDITVTGANIFGGEALADRFASVVSVTRDDEARTISFHASSMSGKVFFTQFKPNTQYTLILYGSNGTAVTNLHIRYTDGSVDTPKFAASGEASYAVLVTDAGKSVEALRGSYSNGRTTLYYDRCGIFEGVLTEADYEAYQGQTMTVAVPDGLRGIPVAADGNHVDASGQQWVADYIDIPGKAMNNVLDSFVLDGSEGYEWTIATSSGLTVAYVGPQDKWSTHDTALVNDTRLMGTHFVGGMMTEVGRIKLDSNFINMTVPDNITNSTEMNAWLAVNPVTVLYVRETPIVTPLALDDITLHSPDAAAYNDSGCSMHLTYDADTKTYIDNKFAAMTAALLSTGANV